MNIRGTAEGLEGAGWVEGGAVNMDDGVGLLSGWVAVVGFELGVRLKIGAGFGGLS